eukprot:gene10574-7344_t
MAHHEIGEDKHQQYECVVLVSLQYTHPVHTHGEERRSPSLAAWNAHHDILFICIYSKRYLNPSAETTEASRWFSVIQRTRAARREKHMPMLSPPTVNEQRKEKEGKAVQTRRRVMPRLRVCTTCCQTVQ